MGKCFTTFTADKRFLIRMYSLMHSQSVRILERFSAIITFVQSLSMASTVFAYRLSVERLWDLWTEIYLNRQQLTDSVAAFHKLYMVSLGGSEWFDDMSIFPFWCMFFHKGRIWICDRWNVYWGYERYGFEVNRNIYRNPAPYMQRVVHLEIDTIGTFVCV